MNKQPRLRTDPGKRRRFKNLYQNDRGDWTIDFSAHGRRIIRVIGKSRREAEDRLAALKTDLIRGGPGILRKPGQGVLFKDFALEFLKDHSSKKKSYYDHEGTLRRHLTPFFGNLRLTDIKAQVFERYKNKRADEYDCRQKKEAKERRVISPASINRELALLKAVLNKALEWEKIEQSPVNWRRVKMLPETARERYLSPAEKAKLFEKVGEASPYLKNFLVLAVNTGLRKSEILGLRWQDIDLANGEIILEQARRKSKKALRVPINRVVIEVLSAMPHDQEYVFYNPTTKRPVKDVRTAFESACQLAGIEDLRIHDLRHTFATALSAKGVDVPTISRMLGHSSIVMTSKYINRVDSSMRKAADIAADVFGGREEAAAELSRKDSESNSEAISSLEPESNTVQ